MRAAEKQTGIKIKNGIYDWSPSLEKAGQTITYWKLRLLQLFHKDGLDDRITNMQQSLHISDNGVADKTYIKKKLSVAWKSLREVQKNASCRELPIPWLQARFRVLNL